MSQITNFKEYQREYQQSVQNPEKFWAEQAERFAWHKMWDSVVEWDFEQPKIRWFENGKLNIVENCLDRHLQERASQTAIIWEPNDSTEPTQHITYAELHLAVCRFANMLEKLGITKGDRVCIYLPMIPELAIAMLACARIGAVHSVVFAGFSSKSIADRINDSACKMVITSDGMYRGAKEISLKSIIDEAIEGCASVEKVVVVKRTGCDVEMIPTRDLWLHEALAKMDDHHTATVMDSEDMLFILYTSGSTGKPKGVVHTCGGYMVYTEYTFRNVFQYQEKEVYWCTADIGWITGHSYIIYGPLLAGATTVMFEGIPTWPNAGRFWHVVDKHQINIFYTAPTAIRSLMAAGNQYVEPYSLASLRVLGSVGEPINEEAWHWYHTHIGKSKCPIVDTWWQTETGGILISPLAGITPTQPAFATLPLPGVQAVLLDKDGNQIEDNNVEGYLCIKFPWPGMLRTTYGDHERCRSTYFSAYPGYYFTGDGAKRNADGYYRIIGRVDDVINVSGHRFGTAEIENAINEHPLIIESAVVGYPHSIKGQGIYAYVIYSTEEANAENVSEEVKALVSKLIGPIAKPDIIQCVSALPKTRSGKIMRRILRKVAGGERKDFGDISTLLNPEIIEHIVAGANG